MGKRYKYLHIPSFLLIGAIVISWVASLWSDGRVKAQEQREMSGISVSLPPVDSGSGSSLDESSGAQLTPVLSSFDTDTDSSFQKYLGSGAVLQDPNYIPQDLLPIESHFTANDASRFFLRKEAGDQFADLAWHFWNTWKGDRLTITSAYRSADFQEILLKKGCSRAKCAQVGRSEHQLGLAIDLGVITKSGKYVALAKGNVYYQWMSEHAPQWGFHNSYQKGIDIDGQMQEARHRRYLGKDLAQYLKSQQVSFGELKSGG